MLPRGTRSPSPIFLKHSYAEQIGKGYCSCKERVLEGGQARFNMSSMLSLSKPESCRGLARRRGGVANTYVFELGSALKNLVIRDD